MGFLQVYFCIFSSYVQTPSPTVILFGIIVLGTKVDDLFGKLFFIQLQFKNGGPFVSLSRSYERHASSTVL